MKKLLLFSCFLMLSYTYSQAQIIVYCESPASVAGSKEFTWAQPGSGWGTKDLSIPANSIKDTVMVVDDGTAADSLGCGPLVNNLTGKIALVYRGTCQFGDKVKNAQDAGAVGVIVINNVAGAPFGMSGGTNGPTDTIPAVMVSDVDGAALRAAVDAGSDVVVFIGNKFGLYNNDLGLYAIDALTSRVTANPKLISTSATEFNVPMGGWIHNYGINTQSNVTLNAAITGAATYNAASTPVTIAPGDSVWVSIPTYSAASYNGLYEVNYTVTYGATDDFLADNVFYSNFLIDSLFSYALIDAATKMPKSSIHYKPQTPPNDYRTCVHFRDANASRLAALGLYASATTTVTSVLDGEAIDGKVYEWNDVFAGLSDTTFFNANTPAWNLNEIGTGTYTYPTNQQAQMVYIPFNTAVPLVNNQRYLFCAVTYNSTLVNLGFDVHFNYAEALDSVPPGGNGYDQPISIVISDASYFATGFGSDATASVSVKFGANNSSVNENDKSFDVTPYPNPTSEFIRIPLKGMYGTAQLKIMDMNGNMVNGQTVKVAEDMSVNVTGISNGNYVFNMLFEDGRNTTFKVVITK